MATVRGSTSTGERQWCLFGCGLEVSDRPRRTPDSPIPVPQQKEGNEPTQYRQPRDEQVVGRIGPRAEELTPGHQYGYGVQDHRGPVGYGALHAEKQADGDRDLNGAEQVSKGRGYTHSVEVLPDPYRVLWHHELLYPPLQQEDSQRDSQYQQCAAQRPEKPVVLVHNTLLMDASWVWAGARLGIVGPAGECSETGRRGPDAAGPPESCGWLAGC